MEQELPKFSCRRSQYLMDGAKTGEIVGRLMEYYHLQEWRIGSLYGVPMTEVHNYIGIRPQGRGLEIMAAEGSPENHKYPFHNKSRLAEIVFAEPGRYVLLRINRVSDCYADPEGLEEIGKQYQIPWCKRLWVNKGELDDRL